MTGREQGYGRSVGIEERLTEQRDIEPEENKPCIPAFPYLTAR